MIKKIIKIKGIGKFEDYSFRRTNSWNGEFKKFNIIYADNANGKSTLTSILRSAKENDPSIIFSRKTVGYTNEQLIEILLDSNNEEVSKDINVIFKDKKWNNSINNIEIFDAFFVNENIYSGFEISSEHKKSIYNFVIGKKNSELTSKIEKRKKEINEEQKKLKEINDKLSKIVKKHYEIDEYVQLTNVDNKTTDDKILKIETKIKLAEKPNKVKTTKMLSKIQFNIPIDITCIKNLLQKDVSDIKEEYIRLVNEHKSKLTNMDIDAENWIKKGYDNILLTEEGKRCPFCFQYLNNTIEIIEAYNQFFNKEYNQLKKDVDKVIQNIQNINIDNIILNTEKKIIENKNLLNFWKDFINIKNTKFNGDDIFKDKDRYVMILIKDLLTQKSKSMLDKPKNIDGLIDDYINFKKSINTLLDEYNKNVENCNKEIESYKTKVHDIKHLETDLEKLVIRKKRCDNEIIELCNNYETTKKTIKLMKDEVRTKQSKLSENNSILIKKYGDKINNYLEMFGVDFKITELIPSYVSSSKTPQIEYNMQLGAEIIKLKEKNNELCFKNTFSDGDKRSLSLSFFLSKLEGEDLSKKIIIFDDPISSFDKSRRDYTKSHLISLSQKVEGIIILTHDMIFARELWKEIYDKEQLLCLQIKRCKKTNIICEWDIEKETSGQFSEAVDMLSDYLDNGSRDNKHKRHVASMLRIVLETYLKIKFHDKLKKKDKHTLGNIIESLKKENCINNDDIELLKTINTFSKKYHHPNNDDIPEDQELRSFVKKTFSYINK